MSCAAAALLLFHEQRHHPVNHNRVAILITYEHHVSQVGLTPMQRRLYGFPYSARASPRYRPRSTCAAETRVISIHRSALGARRARSLYMGSNGGFMAKCPSVALSRRQLPQLCLSFYSFCADMLRLSFVTRNISDASSDRPQVLSSSPRARIVSTIWLFDDTFD